MHRGVESRRLVGRERELGAISDFLAAALHGGGGLLLLGEMGVGKTALLEAGTRSSDALGMSVVRISGAEFEAEVNYSGLNQLVHALSAEFNRLSRVHRDALSVALGATAGDPPDRLLVANAAFALFQAEAAVRPLLIAADDVQWFDRSTAWTLAFVARRIANCGVAFLGTTRLGAESFFEGNGLQELVVGPLTEPAAQELLSQRHPDLGPSVRERIVAEAQGLPLALLELPTILNTRQRIQRDPLPAPLTLSKRLQSLYAARISELPRSCRRILLLCALDGTDDLRVLRRISGHRTLEELVPAELRNLIAIDLPSNSVRFCHPLIRSAIVAFSTIQEISSAHRALAESLVDFPERQARHLAEATSEPDEAVASRLEQVALTMQSNGNHVGSASLLVRAADLSVSTPDRARRISQAAYLAASSAVGDVAELLEDARRVDPENDTSLHFACAAAYMTLNGNGDVATAHYLVDNAVRSHVVHECTDRQALIAAIETLGFMSYLGLQSDMWASFHDAISRLEPEVPEILRLQDGVWADPLRATQPMLDELETAVESLRTESDPMRICAIAGCASSVNRAGNCTTPLWRVVDDARLGQAPGQAVAAITILCVDGFEHGRWDQVDQLGNEGLAICARQGYTMLEWVLRYHLAMVAAARGMHDSVKELTLTINEWGAMRGVRLAHAGSNHARQLAALGEGDFDHAYQLATAISPVGTIPSHSLHALWVATDLVEAALRTNRRAEALAHVDAMRSVGTRRISSRLALLTTAAEALVSADDDAANALYGQALEDSDAEQWKFDYARVQLLYGEFLRRRRAHANARQYLRAAYESFQELRAAPWQRRAERELRAAGGPGSLTTQSRNAQLTAQEREIASLAASGLTNKQIAAQLFMSHRTVSAHLYRIFPKLGITSRAALRDALSA